MMGVMGIIEEWWAKLTDDQRSELRDVYEANDHDAVLDVLSRLRCPMPFVGVQWNNGPMTATIPKPVADLIEQMA